MDEPGLKLPPGGLTGVAVNASFDVPRGTIVTRRWGVQVHPSDHMIMRNHGRVPLFTRHMPGVIEAERDARRRRMAAR